MSGGPDREPRFEGRWAWRAAVRGARIVSVPALLAAVLIGCGQTGPLYLPQVPSPPPARPDVAQPATAPAAIGSPSSQGLATESAAKPPRKPID